MKIACIIASLGLGGAERQLVYLAETLAEIGHDVLIITYHEGNFYEDYAIKAGLRVINLARGTKGAGGAFAHNDTVANENSAPEHTNSNGNTKGARGTFTIVRRMAATLKAEEVDAAVAFLVGASTKAALAHILYPHFRLFVSERCLNKHYLPHDALRFQLFRRAEKIICNSYAQGNFVCYHCPTLKNRVVVIPNFVDTEHFCPAESDFDKNIDDNNTIQHRRILVTARGAKRKNALGLIAAASILVRRGQNNFVIDWYGFQEDGYKEECTKAIQRLGLNNFFHLHPSEKDVLSLYRKSTVFCLPSFYEGTPNSLAEALACGLPCACSNVSDNALYVHHNINGALFKPDNPESIARALEKLLSLPEKELQEMGKNSREIAISLLGRNGYIHSYRQILGDFKGI